MVSFWIRLVGWLLQYSQYFSQGMPGIVKYPLAQQGFDHWQKCELKSLLESLETLGKFAMLKVAWGVFELQDVLRCSWLCKGDTKHIGVLQA